MKKTLDLKDAAAFLEDKASFMKALKDGSAASGDQWNQPDTPYRVGIRLVGRELKPIYFYSDSLHDAKFLVVNITLYGNQFKTLTMSNHIEFAYLIEKSSRFQQVMRVFAVAKEKRFVQMHDF